MEINFKVNRADLIPPLFNESLQLSDWYFGKTKTLSGEIKKCMVAYDFKLSKWLFYGSGHVELIEYYE